MVKKGTKNGKVNKNRVAKSSAAQKGKAFSSSNASTNPDRALPDSKKAGFYRSKATINRLNMYRGKPDEAARHKDPNTVVRIQPDRRWFGNTRVASQGKLATFREEMSKAANDPYSVILKRSKLPMALLTEPSKPAAMNLLSVESFEETFGKKAQRKRPKIESSDLEALVEKADESGEKYSEEKDSNLVRDTGEYGEKSYVNERVFDAGTSRRIWAELYKVVDSSDVIVMVIDARDPMGTRCQFLERSIRKDRPHKHIVLLMNKVDLIPTWATRRWVKVLSREFPTLAFHSSLTNAFGKQALINLLRQYAQLMKDRKHVSVGFIGFPNVGKSSVINTLKKKKVCKVAPIPGETKVWQYVTLTNKIYLIDCPGVVPSDPACQDNAMKVLRGVVRAEKVEMPADYIDTMLEKVKKEYLLKRYGLPADLEYANAEEFLEVLARKMGKLLKGGEPDIQIAARIMIYDWQRGRIPYFEPPPLPAGAVEAMEVEGEGEGEAAVSGMMPAESGAEGGGASSSSAPPPVPVVVKVKQSFKELSCAVEYSEKDKTVEGAEGEDVEGEGEEEEVEGEEVEEAEEGGETEEGGEGISRGSGEKGEKGNGGNKGKKVQKKGKKTKGGKRKGK
uniref:Nucleolar GTP-binding protein 2 n=1 Tax=Chromera velia CCMP2878 TaxID=1169474 RepID=A0A0G4I4M9_9ALVE|eukprot:Cvel_10942.t1-p1 / transcript=Cvel_10942.t1 / gene=Cvel_10942 / organism=Chromera_velia_CCMP2878 / gene_product=Nucleolar GTP-binding protein 2, putative / transcript_product=Nucleolar GTP-binding protein 2, putative / location=Cvel_scaffold673:10283-13555(-) / protein_length=619 / sequence_SO=supercontig / SO=protein_coding / is_pseudo=false